MILRVLKQQYELLRSTDVVRAGKGAVQAAGVTLLDRLVSINGTSVLTGMRCISGGLKPTATGADSQVTFRPGLAVLYTPAESDEWVGAIQWAAIESPQSVAMSTNNDASGHDRIDSIGIRFVDVEEDPLASKVKDPITGNIEDRTLSQRVRRDIEFKIFEGTPAVSPVAATVDAGWHKVAEVTRVNGVANVATSDVTDSRAVGEGILGHLRVEGVFSTALGLTFGDHSADGIIIEPDITDAPTKLEMRQEGAGGDVTFLAPLLEASTALVGNKLKTISGGVLSLRDNGDINGAKIRAINTPAAMAQFYWVDPGGALADGTAATVTFDDNITSVVYQDDTEDYVEITFDTAIDEGAAAVILCTKGGRTGGGTSTPGTTEFLAQVMAGGATARIYFNGGGAPPTEQKFNVVVYGTA